MAATSNYPSLPAEVLQMILCFLLTGLPRHSIQPRQMIFIRNGHGERVSFMPYTPSLRVSKSIAAEGAQILYANNRFIMLDEPSVFCRQIGKENAAYIKEMTVWVARDSELKQWVSMKIIIADRTNQSRELHNLRTLAEYSRGNLGSKNIVQLLDDFLHKGPNGCHQCLVFELLGPTVDMIVNDYQEGERLDTETLLKVSTQLLQAVAFMHEAGYAHGDLSVKNLAFTSGRLSHLSEKELFQILGIPESEEPIRLDGAPLEKGIPDQLVRSVGWVGWPDEEDEDDEDIRVIDLGEAFLRDAVPERLAQPRGLQAPETIFTDTFDYRLDLWRVGLIIYYLTFGEIPFQWFRTDILVASMIDFVGELPPEWQPKWERLRLGAKGHFEREENWQLPGSRLARNFDDHVHEPELKVLLPVIKGLTMFLPSNRISASQALDLIRDECTNGFKTHWAIAT